MRSRSLAALAASCVVSLSLALAAEPEGPAPSELGRAWRLSRGEGASVAVVGTDEALVARVRAVAPGARVFFISCREERAGPARGRARARAPDADAGLARCIESALAERARVILIAAARREAGESLRQVI